MLITRLESLGLLPAKAEMFNSFRITTTGRAVGSYQIYDINHSKIPIERLVSEVSTYAPQVCYLRRNSFSEYCILLNKADTGWYIKYGGSIFVRMDQQKAKKLFQLKPPTAPRASAHPEGCPPD